MAFNVVPTRATLSFSLRPAPGDRVEDLLAEAERRVRAATAPHADRLVGDDHREPVAAAARSRAASSRCWARAWRDPIDLGFWTEAARFVRARHRRGRVRSGRRRAGARRRRVRRDRRARDGRSAASSSHVLPVMEAEIVQRFLESVGAKADIDLYLKLLRAQRKESFAILAPNAQIVKSALDPLHFDLRILAGLGLVPVVVLGLLEPKDADAQATRVSEWLVEDDVPVRRRARDGATRPSAPTTLAAIRATVARGAIPLVSLEATRDAHERDARFGLLASLAGALETRKVVFLSRRAGPGAERRADSAGGQPGDRHERLLAPGALPRGQAMLLRQVKQLVEARAAAAQRHGRQPAAAAARAVHGQRRRHADPARVAHRRARPAGTGIDRARIEALFESAFERPVRAGFLRAAGGARSSSRRTTRAPR